MTFVFKPISAEKESEVRKNLRSGHKSRYAIVRDLVEFGMAEDAAMELVDHIASDEFGVPTAGERAEIRQKHIQREQISGYRSQIILGSLLLAISLIIGISGLSLGLVSILGAVLGLGLVLYGVRIMILSQNI